MVWLLLKLIMAYLELSYCGKPSNGPTLMNLDEGDSFIWIQVQKIGQWKVKMPKCWPKCERTIYERTMSELRTFSQSVALIYNTVLLIHLPANQYLVFLFIQCTSVPFIHVYSGVIIFNLIKLVFETVGN